MNVCQEENVLMLREKDVQDIGKGCERGIEEKKKGDTALQKTDFHIYCLEKQPQEW